MAQDEEPKEPPTVDETRSARYRREHEQFLEESLKPPPPLSDPPPAPRTNGWLARTLWFLVGIYVAFHGARFLIRLLSK